MTNSSKNRLIRYINTLKEQGITGNDLVPKVKAKASIPDEQIAYLCFNNISKSKMRKIRL